MILFKVSYTIFYHQMVEKRWREMDGVHFTLELRDGFKVVPPCVYYVDDPNLGV